MKVDELVSTRMTLDRDKKSRTFSQNHLLQKK
jgi:hypothetical protein